MRGLNAVVFSVIILSGCSEIRVHRTFEIQPAGVAHVEQYKFVALGFKSITEPVHLNERCPEGWEDLAVKKTPLQSLLTVVSLNLYSPWTVEYSCKK